MTKRKEIVKENTHMGARFFMIYLMFSLSFFTAHSFSIVENSIIESPYYRTAQIDFETDEPAVSLIEIGTNSESGDILDVSDEFSQEHRIILSELEPQTQYFYTLFATNQEGEQSEIAQRSFTTVSRDDVTLEFYGNIPEYYNDRQFTLIGRTYPDAIVTVFVNNATADVRSARADGSFSSRAFSFDTSRSINTVQIEVYDQERDETWRSEVSQVRIDTTDPVLTYTEIPQLYPDDSIEVFVNISKPAFLTAYVTHPNDEVYTVTFTEFVEANASTRLGVPLDDGVNEILLIARDRAGNIVQSRHELFVDTVEPEILTNNLAELDPSYTSSVTITGTVNKPNLRVIANVSFRDTRARNIQAAQESNESFDFDATFLDDQTYETTSESEPNADGTYDFSLPIRLAGDLNINLGIGTVSGLDGANPTTQTGAVGAEGLISTGVGDNNARINDILVTAVDRLQRTAETSGEISLQSCGPGGLWQVRIGEVYPAILQPDLIFRGLAQMTFKLELQFLGDNPSGNMRVTQLQMDQRRLSELDRTEYAPQEMLDPGRCVFSPSSGDNLQETYVVCSLSAFPPERHQNITEAQRILERDLGQVSFPLYLNIGYTYENSRGETNTQFHRECIEPQIAIDRRIPPDAIPSGFLNATVTILETIIESIDTILAPLRTTKLVTFGVCLVSLGVQFFSSIGETIACTGINAADEAKIERTLRGCDSSSCPELKNICQSIDNSDPSSLGSCQTCATAISRRLSTEHFRNYVCDRIFCPAIPSAQAYIRDVNQNPFANPTSACLNVGDSEGGIFKNPWSNTAQVTPSDAVIVKDNVGFSSQFGCGKEYNDRFSPSCIVYDAVAESQRLLTNEPRQGFGGFIDNLPFCKAAERQEQGQSIREGGVTYFKAPDSDCYQLGQDRELAEFSSQSSRRNDLVVDPNSVVQSVRQATIPNNQPQCVQTLPSGELVFQPVVRDESGNITFTTDGNMIPMTYNPAETQSFEITNAQPGQASRQVLTNFTSNNRNIGVDSAGNYYEITTGEVTRMRSDDGFFQRVCIKERTQGAERFDVYDLKDNSNCVPLRGPDEARVDVQQEILIDPTANILNALRCGCIPALEGYLQVWRNILSAVKNCFQAILVTGEFQGGACRAVLTQYLCDLIFEAIKCFFNAASGVAPRDTGDLSPASNIFSNIQQAGSRVSDSVTNRYGDTASYSALIGNRRALHAICLAAFGYDFIPELDQALSIQGGGFSVNTTAFVQPATRRFMSFNPTSQGEVTFIYHIGYFISAGANINWRLEMKCSNDMSCNPDEGFEGGRCDCYYDQNQNVQPYLLDGGFLQGGAATGAGDGRGDLYRPVTSPVRYDKVRISWTDTTGGGNDGDTGWRDISGIGDLMPTTCYFSLLTFRFGCDHSSSNEFGEIYFTGPRVQLNNQDNIYYLDDSLRATVYATQNFEGVSPDKQLPKFAQMRVFRNNQQVFSPITSRRFDFNNPPVVLGEINFGRESNSNQRFAVSNNQEPLQEGHDLPFAAQTNRIFASRPVAYYINVVEKENGENTFTNSSSTNLAIEYIRVTRSNDERSFTKESNIITFLTNSDDEKPTLGGFSVSNKQTAQIHDSSSDQVQVILEDGVQFLIDNASVRAGQGRYLEITRENEQVSRGLICASRREQEELEVRVTLHNGRAENPNAQPNPSTAVMNSETFNGQEEVITITLMCQTRAEATTQAETGSTESQELAECDTDVLLTASSANCLCGDEQLRPSGFTQTICTAAEPPNDLEIRRFVQVCLIGDSDCFYITDSRTKYCSENNMYGRHKEQNVCKPICTDNNNNCFYTIYNNPNPMFCASQGIFQDDACVEISSWSEKLF